MLLELLTMRVLSQARGDKKLMELHDRAWFDGDRQALQSLMNGLREAKESQSSQVPDKAEGKGKAKGKGKGKAKGKGKGKGKGKLDAST